jgi:hypothetical protein
LRTLFWLLISGSAAVALQAAVLGCPPALAAIAKPVTVDGPSSSITDFGGVSRAADGSGGLVYLKVVGGIPHVFVSRYLGGDWSAPLRADSSQRFGAKEPRIAAGPDGELLVVWETPVATFEGRARWGLYSARLAAGAHSFQHPLLIDPNVGEGIGLAPSLSRTAPGQATVAYRVVTYNFNGLEASNVRAVQLRPGDVMADIRVARLSGERWSRLGAINRNEDLSMRPPSPTNGPQVGAGEDGGAVVAWQEPDRTGAARIWMRRIFGTTVGPVVEASPSSWEGKAVTADADAFSLAVTDLDQARLAVRIGAAPGSALAGRVLLSSLAPSYSPTAGRVIGPTLADGGASAPLGPPAVGVSGQGGGEGFTRLAFIAGSQLQQLALGPTGSTPSAVSSPSAPTAQAAATPVAAATPGRGGIVAYPAVDAHGRPAVAVRQEFPSGAMQTGTVSGQSAGPVSELALGSDEEGGALIGFRQGEPGRYQIVGLAVGVPPAPFKVRAPKRWVRPRRALLRWQAAPSTVGGVTYSVMLDGRDLRKGLHRRRFRPAPAELGGGVHTVRVLAIDRSGQASLSSPARLRVDGQAPSIHLSVSPAGVAKLRIRDSESGLVKHATRVRWGDGDSLKGVSRAAHAFQRGRYTVLVRARDRAGNAIARRFEVVAR